VLVFAAAHRTEDGLLNAHRENLPALRLTACREIQREWKTSSEDDANLVDLNKVACFISQERVILQQNPELGTDIQLAG